MRIRGRTPRLLVSLVSLLIAGAAGPVWAQSLGQANTVNVSPWRVVAALGLSLTLAAAAALALRYRLDQQAGRRPGSLRVLVGLLRPGLASLSRPRRHLHLQESLRVSPQLEICLFNFDDEQFLVAASPQGATVLDRRPVPASAIETSP